MNTPLTAEEYIVAAQSKSTREAYAKDIVQFLRNGGSIPATPEQIMAYLAKSASVHSPATIARRIVAIHRAHTDAGYESPTKHPMVKRTMQGIRRTLGVRQRQARPLIAEDVLQMLVLVDQQRPIKAARDRAILLVGLAGALRRSELCAISCEDITDYSNGIEILLKHSKTDQEMHGRVVVIPFSEGKYCPVKSVRDWLALTGIKTGQLFRAVNRHDQISDKPLTPQSVALIVKQAAERIGIDPASVSAHSLRAGFCTTAATLNFGQDKIMEQTGHKSLTTLARYIRPVAKRRAQSIL